MFTIQVPVLEKVLRTGLIYATIVVLLRLAGKRSLANLTTLDLAVFLLLSNVLQNAIIGNDSSVTGGVIGAVTLVAINAVLNHATARSERLALLSEGRPTTVIRDGHLIEQAMRRLALRPAEVEHAVRMQNGDAISEIETGCLEPGGQLVLTLKEQEQGATKADVAAIQSELAHIRASLGTLVDNAR